MGHVCLQMCIFKVHQHSDNIIFPVVPEQCACIIVLSSYTITILKLICLHMWTMTYTIHSRPLFSHCNAAYSSALATMAAIFSLCHCSYSLSILSIPLVTFSSVVSLFGRVLRFLETCSLAF